MSRFQKLTRAWRNRIRDFRPPAMLTTRFYWKIFTFPFLWLVQNWRQKRLRDLLMGIPALVGIVGIPVCFAKLQIQEQSLSHEYLNDAQAAVDAKEYPRAELLLTRVLHRPGTVVNDARFLMAVLMEETDRKDRAAELFHMLAPDDRRGNPAAHRRMAMLLANGVDYRSDPLEIKRLQWHLVSAETDHSPEMALAWGRYSLAIQDLKAAERHFKEAVGRFPELWQTLGAIESQTGKTASAVASFQRSSDYLQKELDKNPDKLCGSPDEARTSG